MPGNNHTPLVRWIAIGSLTALGLDTAFSEAVFIANFNRGADADFSTASRTALPHDGAKITTGGQGHRFEGEQASEALDLTSGGVEYEVPLRDLSRGTIELWIKTAFDWRKPPGSETVWAGVNYLWIPAAGGGRNRISLGASYRVEYRSQPPLYLQVDDGTAEENIGLARDNPLFDHIDSQAGVWHYVAATWNPRQLRLFLDGRLVAEKALAKPLHLQEVDEPMVLGSFTTSLDAPLGVYVPPAHAWLDGVRISDEDRFVGQREIPVPKHAPGK